MGKGVRRGRELWIFIPTLIWLQGPEFRERRQRNADREVSREWPPTEFMAIWSDWPHWVWSGRGGGESPSFRGGRVSHVEFTIYLSTLKNKHFFVLASFPALQTEATLSLPSCLFIFRESVSFSGFRVPAVVQVADLISNPRQSMDIVIYSFNRERLNVPLRQTQFRFWESDSEEDRQGVYP